jgi:hypothetical protein
MENSWKKWRSIVDGDVWFFVKGIPLGDRCGLIGAGYYSGPQDNVRIYIARGGIEGIISLTADQARQLVAFIEECHEKAKTIASLSASNEWGKEGTYIIREMTTETGVVIHVCSWIDGEVNVKFVLYDSKGEDYYRSALAVTCHLKKESLHSFLASLEKALKGPQP